MSNVQIPHDIYIDLVLYFFDEDERTREREERIKAALQSKAEAMQRRDAYTRYKCSEDSSEREQARQKYLTLANIGENFKQ